MDPLCDHGKCTSSYMIVSIYCIATESNSHGVASFGVKFQLPYVKLFVEFVQVFMGSYWISWVGNGSVKETVVCKTTELKSYSCWVGR